jgi:uncharacterized delta-60 repeat protein
MTTGLYKLARSGWSALIGLGASSRRHRGGGRLVATLLPAGGTGLRARPLRQRGTPDSGFSGNGEQLTDFGGFDQAKGVAIQQDGKLVVSGITASSETDYDFAVARYKTDGTLDTTFSGDGRATTDFGFPSQALDLIVQPDGKIVLAGGIVTGPGSAEFALARYNPDGTPDMSFSGDGQQRTSISGAATALVLQPDGKIVLVGGFFDQFALARYTPDGNLDTTFSLDGLQVTTFPAGRASATDAVLDPDGRILVVGVVEGDFGAARYHPSGNLDPSFAGEAGRPPTSAGRASSGTATSPTGSPCSETTTCSPASTSPMRATSRCSSTRAAGCPRT